MINSASIQGVLRKAAAAVIGFMLAMVLLTALLIAGFVLLVNAATLALSPWVGEAGALGITGFSCFALLALFFYRLTRPVKPSNKSDDSGSSEEAPDMSPVAILKNIIRKNPWEAALTAFAIGVVENGDPRLRALLLQGGMTLMKQAGSDTAANESVPPSGGTKAAGPKQPEVAPSEL